MEDFDSSLWPKIKWIIQMKVLKRNAHKYWILLAEGKNERVRLSKIELMNLAKKTKKKFRADYYAPIECEFWTLNAEFWSLNFEYIYWK